MTPDQAAILSAVAKAAAGYVDTALADLIEDGLLDYDQHILSEDYEQARIDVEVEMGVEA